MYKYVFFDLDDTLWDFHQNAKDSLCEAYFKLKLDKYFNDFEHFFHIYINRNNELWELYAKGLVTKEFLMHERFRYPLEQVDIHDEKFVSKISTLYMNVLPTKTHLLPYAKELLDYLISKYSLSIISNGFIEVQHKKLKNTEIYEYFDHIILSENAKALKPDKRIFEYALNLNNAEAKESIMIGDLYQADIIGAKNAGIDQIFMNIHKTVLKYNESPTHIVYSLEEILNIL